MLSLHPGLQMNLWMGNTNQSHGGPRSVGLIAVEIDLHIITNKNYFCAFNLLFFSVRRTVVQILIVIILLFDCITGSIYWNFRHGMIEFQIKTVYARLLILFQLFWVSCR